MGQYIDNSVFDSERIRKRMKDLEGMPPFKPGELEARFTVTQFFEDIPGKRVECTLWFVIRDGDMIFYDSKTKKL